MLTLKCVGNLLDIELGQFYSHVKLE